MAKSPEAFRTISEVADELQLPQHVLRFWETRFVQIRPMKRGGGRRYYRPDDIDLLRGIRYLLYGEGYTIRGVQRILKEQGPRFVIGAGRGDMSDVYPPQPDDEGPDEEVIVAPADDLDMAEEADATTGAAADEDDHIEPTFDPREFRPEPVAAPPAPSLYAPVRQGGLGADDVRRLQATLASLLEMKRLLDSARD